jgi:hypothetical protein
MDEPEQNVRDEKPISPQEREAIRQDNQLTGFLEYDELPGWQLCEVRPQMLRVVHDDFRHEPLIKGELINSYLARVRRRIDADDFPFSEDIRRTWSDKPPVYVLRMRSNEELYVYDGQLRTLNACYSSDEWISALLVDVDEEREII